MQISPERTRKSDSKTPCVKGKKQASSVTWLRQGYGVLPCSQDWGGGRSPWGPAWLRPKKLIGSVLQWRTLHKKADPYEGPQGGQWIKQWSNKQIEIVQ